MCSPHRHRHCYCRQNRPQLATPPHPVQSYRLTSPIACCPASLNRTTLSTTPTAGQKLCKKYNFKISEGRQHKFSNHKTREDLNQRLFTQMLFIMKNGLITVVAGVFGECAHPSSRTQCNPPGLYQCSRTGHMQTLKKWQHYTLPLTHSVTCTLRHRILFNSPSHPPSRLPAISFLTYRYLIAPIPFSKPVRFRISSSPAPPQPVSSLSGGKINIPKKQKSTMLAGRAKSESKLHN